MNPILLASFTLPFRSVPPDPLHSQKHPFHFFSFFVDLTAPSRTRFPDSIIIGRLDLTFSSFFLEISPRRTIFPFPSFADALHQEASRVDHHAVFKVPLPHTSTLFSPPTLFLPLGPSQSDYSSWYARPPSFALLFFPSPFFSLEPRVPDGFSHIHLGSRMLSLLMSSFSSDSGLL